VVYNRVSKYEDVVIYSEPTEPPDYNRIRDSLFPLMEEALRYIPTVQPLKDWDDLQKTLRMAMRHLRNKDMGDDLNVLTLAKLFDRSLNVIQNRWTDPRMGRQFKELFQDWKTDTLKPFLQEWRQFLHPKLIECVLPAVQFCTQRR